MGGHSLTSRSSAALLGSNGNSTEATAKRVAVLLFHFSRGTRTFCEIATTLAPECPPARFDSLSAVRLWEALSDAERDALTLPMPSGKNPRLEDGTGGGK